MSKPRTLWGCVGIHINHNNVNKNTAPKLTPPKTNGWNEKKAGGRMFFEIFLLVVFSGSSW